MVRTVLGIGALIAVCVLPALGQSTTTTTETSLADRSPQENASGGAVSQRSPGTWVKAALTRHKSLMAIRLTGPRFGQPNEDEAALRYGESSSATATTTTGGLTGLLDLATQFGGLDSIISTLTGGTPSVTGGGTSGSSSLADMIRAAAEERAAQQKTNNDRAALQTQNEGTSTGGAISRLPKPEQVSQASTTTEVKFGVRWANAMMQTFFTAIAVGLQTSDFIEALKDSLRPLFAPPSDGSGNGSGNGSGIEDIPSNGTGGNGGGSTL